MTLTSRPSVVGFFTAVILGLSATACGSAATGTGGDGGSGASSSDGGSSSEGGSGAGMPAPATLEVVKGEFERNQLDRFVFLMTIKLTNRAAGSLVLDPEFFFVRDADGVDTTVSLIPRGDEPNYCDPAKSVAEGGVASCDLWLGVPEGVSIKAVVYRNEAVELVAPYEATLPPDNECLDACADVAAAPEFNPQCGSNWLSACTKFCEDHPPSDFGNALTWCFYCLPYHDSALDCSGDTLHYTLPSDSSCLDGDVNCPQSN